MRLFWLPCAAVFLLSSLACSLGGSSPEVVTSDPVDGVEVPELVAATEVALDDSSCCCAYIQETSQEKSYDSMLARNCTEWGFECVDDGFCDGTMAAVEPEPAAEPVVAPTPAPAVVAPRPAPRPSSTSMSRPGSGTAPSGTTRPSSGGMTRPGSTTTTTRPSSRPAPSPSPRPSSGGMTRPR